MNKKTIFWFRRDLRLDDNTALFKALDSGLPIIPIFSFDTSILDELPKDDARVNFIYNKLNEIDNELKKIGSSLKVYKGEPSAVWENIISEYIIKKVYFNKDYEPYAIHRDKKLKELLSEKNVEYFDFKDQVIFEENVQMMIYLP